MARFIGFARSTSVQSDPEINNRPHTMAHTRTKASLVAFAASAVVLLLLLIVIMQNGQGAVLHFFGAQGQLPMGIALLLAAVFGALLVTVHATMQRIIQSRPLTRRQSPRHTAAIVTHPDPTADTDPDASISAGRS